MPRESILEKSYQPYNFTVSNYYQSGRITVERWCNGITITNLGDAPASVNGMILYPSATPGTALGDSRSIGGNEGEIFKGNLNLSFDLSGGAVSPQVEIIQKFYVE